MVEKEARSPQVRKVHREEVQAWRRKFYSQGLIYKKARGKWRWVIKKKTQREQVKK